LQVTYDSEDNIATCVPTETNAQVRVLPAPDQFLIVCAQHQGVEVAAALAEHYFPAGGHNHEHDDGDELS
jgi:hypothetical protein